MDSLAAARRLLEKCINVDGIAPLLSQLGFESRLVALTDDGRSNLDLPQADEIRVVSGRDSLRALVLHTRRGTSARDTLQQTSARLCAKAPHLLWLIAAFDPEASEFGIAAFDSSRTRPKVAALIVRLDQIVDSDCETICALAAAATDSDLLTHCRWLEILGRESVSRRFFRELERQVGRLSDTLLPEVAPKDSARLSLLCVSRLLFLSFIETKGWLNRDHGFLANRFADCMVNGGGYHRRVLNPLFFGTLNTAPRSRASRAREFGRIPFLNGGLFARAPIETRHASSFFADDTLGDLFSDLLTRFRFTAREDTSRWSEAAIDPEMLGKAFESLMSSRDRKTSGAFYTPHSLVRDVSRMALRYGLESATIESSLITRILDGDIPPPSARTALIERIGTLRVLDPACGSGAFLVHILEELAALRVQLGDIKSLHAIRRDILTRSIFGVDVNPMAVWLCELRLWLSMAIEDPETDPLRVTPLPNLDRNIRAGDSLSGEGLRSRMPQVSGGRIGAMRSRYARATGPRKKALAKTLDSLERTCAVTACTARIDRLSHERRDLLGLARSPDLFGKRAVVPDISARLVTLRSELRSARLEMQRLRDGGALAFSFSAGFADAAANGGFDIVFGNPPWIRTHNLDAVSRAGLRDRYLAYRHAAWRSGSEAAAAGKGFSSQVDAAALFIERCTDLLRPGAAMALIVPAKLWRSLSGGGVREVVNDATSIRELHDLSDAPHLFDAAVYPSVIVASKRDSSSTSPVIASGYRKRETERWTIPRAHLPLDESPGSPFLIIPPPVRRSFDHLWEAGISLSDTKLGRPLLGTKTGCNDAFLVGADTTVEPELLRPVIRGDQVKKWTVAPDDSRIIWTHDDNGPLNKLPPCASRWLSRWRRELELRSDMRGKTRWWSLFRTESAACSLPRVVWNDIGKHPRAGVLYAGDRSVPLNTCYVVRCPDSRDALTLATIINSPIAAAWLDVIAEPARGGYNRFMGWTMSLLPLPRNWPRACEILSPLARCAMQGSPVSDEAFLGAVLDAYSLRRDEVQPLLDWSE